MIDKIISSKNPYVLDIHENTGLLALTKKNSNFIEAVLQLDSNYKRENAITKPDNGFDINLNYQKSNGKYCGSIRYWFNEMKCSKNQEDYQNFVLGAVVAIDRSNSTHLESTENGRKIIADKITEKCENVSQLIEALNEDFNKVGDKHLISILAMPIQNGKEDNGSQKQKTRMNISFASKFCSYAAQYLLNGKQYSKYDNVVAKNLPKYYKEYCGKNVNNEEFIINSPNKLYKNKNENQDEKFERVLKTYLEYSNAINEIIESLPKNDKLTKDEVDHIIWYGNKG